LESQVLKKRTVILSERSESKDLLFKNQPQKQVLRFAQDDSVFIE